MQSLSTIDQRIELCGLARSLETPLIHISTVPGQKVQFNRPFPLVLAPRSPHSINFIQLQEYVMTHLENIKKCSSEYGAVLFDGFDIISGEEFASVIHKLGLKERHYMGGLAVRKLIVGSEMRMKDIQVVTTTESPSNMPISFHNELAHTSTPPSHILFYCRENESVGGSTPMVRSDLCYDFLLKNYPDFINEIEEKGACYSRLAPKENDLSRPGGRGWKSMFNATTRKEAEIEMEKMGSTWEWQEDESLRTFSVLPAVIQTANGRKSFFHLGFLHIFSFQPELEREMPLLGDKTTPMSKDILRDLYKFMVENACMFQWKKGQFVIVDNQVTSHSREPFKGKRVVYAALAQGEKPISFNQLSFTLSNGDTMPATGLGLWKLPNAECQRIVHNAIKTGYRLLDGAAIYGNEKEVGLGIKQALDEDIVKREELFVTSKLWNTYHRKEHVKDACLKTLTDLGLEYLDLYLVHFPIALKFVPFEMRYPPGWIHDPEALKPSMEEDNVPFYETWAAMEALVEEGLVRNIGVSNMGTSLLRDVCNYAKIKPSVLQVEMHPYLTQDKLLRFCREKGIAVTAYSSFGAGSYVELGMAAHGESCLEEKTVIEIGLKYKKTPAQIVLRWGVQRGTGVIPKTSREHVLKENIDIFDFNLTQTEMEQLNSLNKHRMFNDPGVFCEKDFNTFFPVFE